MFGGLLPLLLLFCPVNSNLITYLGLKTNLQEKISIFPLENRTKTECGCAQRLEPVCGTDGIVSNTYINTCVLDCNKAKVKALRFDYFGPCCSLDHCPNYARPVCDTKGRLYLNNCFFQYSQCIEFRKHNVYLNLSPSTVNCRCNTPCGVEDAPVCDNRGRTHRNLCLFSNAKCVTKLLYKIDLEIVYGGVCCNSACQTRAQPLFPVCDNTGETHDNLCAFYVRQCEAKRKTGRRLFIQSYGRCRES